MPSMQYENATNSTNSLQVIHDDVWFVLSETITCGKYTFLLYTTNKLPNPVFSAKLIRYSQMVGQNVRRATRSKF
jgi:hypothetical protein